MPSRSITTPVSLSSVSRVLLIPPGQLSWDKLSRQASANTTSCANRTPRVFPLQQSHVQAAASERAAFKSCDRDKRAHTAGK